jgi:hypothetical protein
MGKDPKPVPDRPRRGRNDKWEEIYMEITEAQAKELNARIQKNIDNSVPWKEWEVYEQRWHAYYWTGQRCPSAIPGNGYSLKSRMEKLSIKLDLEDTEEGREISKLLEQMEDA